MIPMIEPVERSEKGVRMIDQRKLPLEETHVECTSPEEVAQAIREMVVRGAPANIVRAIDEASPIPQLV